MEQYIYEEQATVECTCKETFTFLVWDDCWIDNPYVEKTCSCGTYYKDVSDIHKQGARIIQTERTGKRIG